MSSSNSPGYIPRDTLSDVFDGNQRMIKGYDLLQSTVYNDPFINAGDIIASTALATKAIPINIDGITYYLKLSTIP